MQKLYNMIIKVDSMDQLTKEGWKIINKIKENRIDIDKKVSIISVLGNKNAGKSFILHLLTGKNIPNGYTVTINRYSRNRKSPFIRKNNKNDYRFNK